MLFNNAMGQEMFIRKWFMNQLTLTNSSWWSPHILLKQKKKEIGKTRERKLNTFLPLSFFS